MSVVPMQSQTLTLGVGAPIDVSRLIETRAIVTANSGGGKSWLLRRLLEQTHGRCQQIVIDPEGEFFTLRNSFDYILAGKAGADCPAEPRSAPLLARKLLQLGISAVIDIFDLKLAERRRFVKLFLDGLIDAPRELWHPAMIVIDEAHVFAPEKGDAESSQAVIDLMTRGRKRGFCGLLATQRPAMLAKDASAQAINKLVGRQNQDVDVKRAGDDLGFMRSDYQRLQMLKPGEFFVSGPAFGGGVQLVKVGPVQTEHPRAGSQTAPPPPPRDKVKAVLTELAEIPREAVQEAQTIQSLQAKVRELERAAKVAPAAPVIDKTAIEKAVNAAVAKTRRDIEKAYAPLVKAAQAFAEKMPGLVPAAIEYTPVDEVFKEVQRPVRTGARFVEPTKTHSIKADTGGLGATSLKGPEQRILNAIAWMESIGVDTPEQTAVAFLAGYTTGGGAYNNPRGALRSMGYIDYVAGDRIRLTDAGREHAAFPEGNLTAEELQSRVMERLPGPERKILTVLIENYPTPISNAECAAASGYAEGGGAFNNPRGRLRTLGLIEYPSPGMLVARPLLFLEGA